MLGIEKNHSNYNFLAINNLNNLFILPLLFIHKKYSFFSITFTSIYFCL